MALIALLLAPYALGVDVDGFRPSSSMAVGQGGPQAESPRLGEEGAAGALIVGFVQDPVIRVVDELRVEDVVSAMVPVTVYGGWTVDPLVRLDLFVPTYAHVEAPITRYQGAAMGDLRLQAVFELHRRALFSLGLAPRVELPTGTEDALTRGGGSAGLAFLGSGQSRDGLAGWVANLGLTGAPREDLGEAALGSTLDAIGAAWWSPDEGFRLGAEVDLHLGLVQGPEGANHTGSGQIFAQQLLADGWGLSVSGGSGMIGGVGSPDYRAIAAIHFGGGRPDADGDGLFAGEDGCPDQPEDVDGFEDDDGCPDPDNDRDGVVDLDDACPQAAEDVDGFEDGDGCPDPDNDGDGVADLDDVCPDKAGETDGCPDSDGDGLPDHFDACPDQPRPFDERIEFADGCPKAVYLTDFAIAHEEPVLFVDQGTEPTPQSLALLVQIVEVILAHPELAKIEILASVEPRNGPRADQRLTEQQAQAVRDWMVEQGVAPDRLIATGMGQVMDDVGFRIVEVVLPPAEASPPAPPAPEPAPTTPPPAPEPPPAPAADPDASPGLLTVVIPGGLEGSVWIDGNRLARSAPFTDHPVAPGSHQVRVVNDQAGIDETRTIEVASGEFVRVVVGPPREFEPEEHDFDLEELTRPERPEPVIDVRVERPKKVDDRDASGKRPPRSTKKR